MKILVLTNLFPTPWDPRRGAFNRQQFERLGRRHEVQVLTAVDFRERHGQRSAVEVPGVVAGWFTYFYPPGVGRVLHAVCWGLSLWAQRGRVLRHAGFDCVLASWGYPDAVAAGWVARRLGVPYVVKVHGSDLNVIATHALRRWQIARALRRAGGVVAVSRALAEKAVAIGADPARTEVIYNGVDGKLFAPGSRVEARERLGVPAAVPLVLYVGNLKPAKGCLDLIEAFLWLRETQPQAMLVYVGAGAARDDIKQRASAGAIGSHVRLVGAVDHAALADWFRAANVLCLPSHNEGVPNVVLEAMASGTPVVATRVGGIPEVVPDYAGNLVPAHDPQALCAALQDVLGRPWDAARIACHAAEFRWEDNVDRLERSLCAAVAAAPVRTVNAT